MGETTEKCGALVSEIAAFYSGNGTTTHLYSSLRATVLIVPHTPHDRLLITAGRDHDWICAFTSELDYARYLLDRGESTASRRFWTITGGHLIDTVIPALGRQTGIYVNTASRLPLAFPPDVLDVYEREAG